MLPLRSGWCAAMLAFPGRSPRFDKNDRSWRFREQRRTAHWKKAACVACRHVMAPLACSMICCPCLSEQGFRAGRSSHRRSPLPRAWDETAAGSAAPLPMFQALYSLVPKTEQWERRTKCKLSSREMPFIRQHFSPLSQVLPFRSPREQGNTVVLTVSSPPPQETKLLQTIDRLKLAAGKENRSTRIARTLASMAAPKQWELQNGNKVEVHTPATGRAAELMQVGFRVLGVAAEDGAFGRRAKFGGLGRKGTGSATRALQSWLVCRSWVYAGSEAIDGEDSSKILRVVRCVERCPFPHYARKVFGPSHSVLRGALLGYACSS
jgi:hypothetical protein